MIRQSLIALAVLAMAGCQASTSLQPFGQNNKNQDQAQLAAYAATAQLPENAQAKTGLQAATIVDRKSGDIRIYNFSDKPLANGNIWIDHAYVAKFNSIPARGYVTMPRSEFYDRSGQSLASTNAAINSVMIQWDNDLYTLEGPAYQ